MAELEILRYVPASLLQGKNIWAMDMDELAEYLAKARYVQELEENLINRALYKSFGDA